MEEITIYTNEQCPYCKEIKENLDKNNIEYIDKLTVNYKEEWQDISALTGLPNIPTIYFKNNYLVPGRDFSNSQHLLNILNNFEESKFPIDRQIIEKVKTLTFQIHTAFGRTDQILRQIENKLNKEE